MLSPSEKRKLRSVHRELSMMNAYLLAMRDRGEPFRQDEIEKFEETLNKQNKRIHSILDPDSRKSSGR